MWHTNTINHILLMILFFMLSQTTANDYNKPVQAKALLATNWWGHTYASSDDHCSWPHIYCNEAGSVTNIYFHNHNLEGGLGSVDFASFPDLEVLIIENCGLEECIPEQIGLLSNLTYLSFHGNLLTEPKKHGDVCSVLNYDGVIAYEDFITATEDFDLKYCIGTGGYGSVCEAKLPNGKTFALKKLHRFDAKQPAFNQSFKNEV
ncbi:putative transferase [Helianthus annuus]|nr:putative transferase [Helianthus annuus]